MNTSYTRIDAEEIPNWACYNDNRIAVIDSLQNFDSVKVVKMGFYMFVLCLKGDASFYINDQLYTINPRNLLLCHPNIMLEIDKVSDDIEFRCVCMTPDYVKQLISFFGEAWNARLYFDRNPILLLEDNEIASFCLYFDLIGSRLERPPFQHQKEVIDSLLMAFLYEFSSVITRYVTINPPDFSSAENLFREFIELLSSESPKKRFVKYYAEKLNVTPKYLSSVCKSISGHTALDLINQYVVKDILYALKKKESSIKDIAYGLDFPNLSFFGKYVKKHLGMSPRMYREKMYKDDE